MYTSYTKYVHGTTSNTFGPGSILFRTPCEYKHVIFGKNECHRRINFDFLYDVMSCRVLSSYDYEHFGNLLAS